MHDKLPPNTRELHPRDFYSPVKETGNLSLAGYKPPPSVVPPLLHTAAAESVHEKDVLTTPDRGAQLTVKPFVTHDDVSSIRFRQETQF